MERQENGSCVDVWVAVHLHTKRRFVLLLPAYAGALDDFMLLVTRMPTEHTPFAATLRWELRTRRKKKLPRLGKVDRGEAVGITFERLHRVDDLKGALALREQLEADPDMRR